MSNLIKVNFSPEALNITRANVTKLGADKTEAAYLAKGLHPTFVKVIIRRAVKAHALNKKYENK